MTTRANQHTVIVAGTDGMTASEPDTSQAEVPGVRIRLKSGRWIEIDDIDLIRVDDDGKRQMAVLWSKEICVGCSADVPAERTDSDPVTKGGET